jgi:hypothetical protein
VRALPCNPIAASDPSPAALSSGLVATTPTAVKRWLLLFATTTTVTPSSSSSFA